MASAGDPPDPDESFFRNLKFNPFKLLGLSMDDLNPDDVRKAYNSKIRPIHPDKMKGKEGLATKLTAAYNSLKWADAEKLKELAQQFNNPGGQQQGGGGGLDLSRVLVDKTKGEHYRRLFKAHLSVAKETHFKDNFQGFYRQVFDEVTTQSPENMGFHCEICDEDFILEDDHFELVYSPYSEYLLEGAEDKGFFEYLETVLDRESLQWTPAVQEAGNWSGETFSACFQGWCEKLESLRNGEWTEEIEKLKNSNGEEAVTLLTTLFSIKDQTVEEICAKVTLLLPKSLEIGNLIDLELMFPAFLRVVKDFNEWYELSVKICTTSTRLSVIFAAVGASLDKDGDINFLKLGESIIKFQRDFGYAHLCFVLGNWDLWLAAQKIISLSHHIECKRLAAYFLLKTNDLEKLENLGKTAMQNGDVDTATVYFTPLIKHHFENGDGDYLLKILCKVLPLNKFWKAVQALVVDDAEFILNCSAAAFATVEKIAREMQTTPQSIVDLLLGAIIGRRMSTVSANTLSVLSGALHVLHGDEERYANAIRLVMREIKKTLDMKLTEGDAEFILELVRIPDVLPVIRETLEDKQFLGPNAIKGQPGSSFYSCLVILRAIYHYKMKQFDEMAMDFATASMYTLGDKIPKAIATFISSNPMIHEKILKVASRQFQQLEAYIDDYTGEALNDANFTEVLQKTSSIEEPHLSASYSSGSRGATGPDLKTLENDILGRDNDNDGNSSDDEENARATPATAKVYADKAFNYVDLEVICGGTYETISCLTMAAQYFLKAMLATPETDIPEKYAYRGLILECSNQIKPYANHFMLPASTALHSLRVMLSFNMKANQHFSEILRKNDKHNGSTQFIDEGEVPDQTSRWQTLLNLRTVCPFVAPEIYTIAEGRLSLHFLHRLYNFQLREKINSGLYSCNTQKFMYHHMLFNEVWAERCSPEDTGYEDDISELFDALKEVIDEEQDSREEKERKKKQNEKLKQEMLESIPLVDRLGFKLTREDSMVLLAAVHGYEIEDVERMMNWSVIRRTPDGFIDMTNRTLNFDAEPRYAYSRFLGVKMNQVTKTFYFLLEPAVSGDPNRPALFTGVDLMEIFGNQICGAFLSFDEQLFAPEAAIPEHIKLVIPFHPFYKVRFAGIGPDGQSKEKICGTNFLMTLYLLDLFAKIFTTGQEIGANFPFPFRDTVDYLLSTLSSELQHALKPIGPRKKVKFLRALELIHRFWFEVEEVEQEIIQGSEQNGYTGTIKYGNASVVLKTMQMTRGKSGELVDAEHMFDQDSPEANFVRGFNEKIHLIEKEFPIIQRVKELAKISQCFGLLHGNKETFQKDIPAFKRVMELQLPSTRPYSKCGTKGQTCNCCDWVPAVYHQMKVTDEQKLEYLFEKNFSMAPRNAISDEERYARVGFHGNEQQEQCTDEQSAGSSAGATDGPQNGSDQKKSSSLKIEQYDRLEVYRCYGGVAFHPNGKDVQGIPPSPWESVLTWENALDVGLFALGFVIPAIGVASAVSKVRSASRIIRFGSQVFGRVARWVMGSKVKLPKNPGQVKHIFRKKDGHLPNTKENQQMLTDLANNKARRLGDGKKDVHGATWSAETLPDGRQAWVRVKDGTIINGGINKTPRPYNPETGLNAPVKPGQK